MITVEAFRDATEDGQGGLVRFTRTGSTTGVLTVNINPGGEATPNSDYQQLPSTVTFAANQTTLDLGVAPINDTATDPDESVSITVAGGFGYTPGSPGGATVIIADNEGVQRAGLYLDFTPYKGLPAHTLHLRWTVWDTATNKDVNDGVDVQIPNNADSDTVRTAIDTALEENGFRAIEKSNNRLVVKAGAGKVLRQLGFVTNLPAGNNITGKIKLLLVTSEVVQQGTITPKLFVEDTNNEVPPP